MDDSLVEAYVSARRKKRLLSPGFADSDIEQQKDIRRLLGCVRKLAGNLPPAERRHVDRILGAELKELLMDFCFDLSAHTHRNDADIAFTPRQGGD